MRVVVNDREVGCYDDPNQSVETLLEKLRDGDELPPGEAVSAVRLDDEAWEGRKLVEVLKRKLNGVQRIGIRTADLRDYAVEILAESGGILDVLLQRTCEVAEAFRTSEATTANVRLFRLLDAIHRFLVCLCTIQNTCSPESKPFEGESGPLARVAESLDRIEENQCSEDWEGLARNLDEQLHPALSELSGSITALKDSI